MSQYGIQSGLPDIPMVNDPQLKTALTPIHTAISKMCQAISDATGKTLLSPSEYSGGADQLFGLDRFNNLVLKANVTIAYSRLMGIANVGGVANWVLADSTSGIQPIAVCVEPGGITAGKLGRGAFGVGLLHNVLGAVAGTMYFVGAAGTFTTAKPASALFSSPIGVGIDSTTIAFQLTWKA